MSTCFLKNEMRLGTSSSQVAINLYMHCTTIILKMKKSIFLVFMGITK